MKSVKAIILFNTMIFNSHCETDGRVWLKIPLHRPRYYTSGISKDRIITANKELRKEIYIGVLGEGICYRR